VAPPREARQSNEFNTLRNCLGKKRVIVFQGVSQWPPKLERGEASIHRSWPQRKFAITNSRRRPDAPLLRGAKNDPAERNNITLL
jgi:hypothetical protein